MKPKAELATESHLVARMVADIVAKEKLLPQPFVVQSRPGGGGAIGQQYAAGKRGDPYTVLVAGTSLLTVPARTGLDVGLDRFQPLGMIGVDLNSLAVREDSPYRTLKDFLAAARANPKTIDIAITFPGGTAHSLMYRLEQFSGARFNFVSFRSGTDAVTAVPGGHVHATSENLGEVMPHVESKKLRLLGVPAMKRPVGLPDLPTMKEQGCEVQRYAPACDGAGGRVRESPQESRLAGLHGAPHVRGPVHECGGVHPLPGGAARGDDQVPDRDWTCAQKAVMGDGSRK